MSSDPNRVVSNVVNFDDPQPRPCVSDPLPSAVDHPPHYNHGKIEAIDVIEDWGLNFAIGSAIKYICRYGHKGDPIEQLEKAVWCISREIARLKSGKA